MKVTVKIAPTTILTNWDCVFCGECFVGESALADLFDEAGEHLGVTCPTCLAVGARRVLSRLSNRSPLWATPLEVSMPPVECYLDAVEPVEARYIAPPLAPLHLSFSARGSGSERAWFARAAGF